MGGALEQLGRLFEVAGELGLARHVNRLARLEEFRGEEYWTGLAAPEMWEGEQCVAARALACAGEAQTAVHRALRAVARELALAGFETPASLDWEARLRRFETLPGSR